MDSPPQQAPPLEGESVPLLALHNGTDADYPDEGLAIASPSPTMSPSPPASPSPPSQQPRGAVDGTSEEEEEEEDDGTLALPELMSPGSERHLRTLTMGGGMLRTQTTRYCLAEPEPTLDHRWLRHCARQSRSRAEWDGRLADGVADVLQRHLNAALYNPTWCSRLTNILARDLLELVMRELGSEFKVVNLLSIGSVTEMDRMSLATRSAQHIGIDTCRTFHYQNESVFAVFTCHLFQRFDKQLLGDAPVDIDDIDGSTALDATPSEADDAAADTNLGQGDEVALL